MCSSDLTIHHVGDPVPSMPHIEMTVAMLAEHGVAVRRSGDSVWHVDPHDIAAVDRDIEPDLSNAAPFLAAALAAGGSVTVPSWPTRTTQPGDAVRGLLQSMGADVSLDADGLHVSSDASITGIDVDLSDVGELAPTIAALAGLLLLLLLSRLATLLLSGLATLLLSHCCLQVQVAAGCRIVKAAIGVPQRNVGGMSSVRHTGSRYVTWALPRFTTHACFSHGRACAAARRTADVGTCSGPTACDTGVGCAFGISGALWNTPCRVMDKGPVAEP